MDDVGDGGGELKPIALIKSNILSPTKDANSFGSGPLPAFIAVINSLTIAVQSAMPAVAHAFLMNCSSICGGFWFDGGVPGWPFPAEP